MAKLKLPLLLSPETQRMLVEYTVRHEEFTTTSQSADHLLMQALKYEVGEAFGYLSGQTILATPDGTRQLRPLKPTADHRVINLEKRGGGWSVANITDDGKLPTPLSWVSHERGTP